MKQTFAKLFLTLLFAGSCFAGFSQSECGAPSIPDGTTLEKVEDYRKADALASRCVNWLLEHDRVECASDYDRLNAFVLVWLSGHPDIMLELDQEAMPFLEAHSELLFPMLHGMARYALDTPAKDQSAVDAHVAGLAAVADACSSDKSLRQDDDLKKLKKARRKGNLAAYYSELIKN